MRPQLSFEHCETTDRARCPICGSADTAEFMQPLGSGYSWWHCHECDLRFSWPMWAGDSSYYQSVWSYAPEIYGPPKHLRTIAQTWEYRVALDYQSLIDGRLLDIGCGPGEFLYLARERYGYQVAGVDFNEEAVCLAQRLYGIENVVCGSWPDAAGAIAGGAFDRVTMFHVVEHVDDPVGAIRSAALGLKPDGLLVVAVPAARRRPGLFNGMRDLPPHHLTLWTENSLVQAFQAAGLEPVWLARRPLLPNDFLNHWLDRFPPLRRPSLSRLLWTFGRRLLAPPVVFARALFPTEGCVIVGIARVPALRRP